MSATVLRGVGGGLPLQRLPLVAREAPLKRFGFPQVWAVCPEAHENPQKGVDC